MSETIVAWMGITPVSPIGAHEVEVVYISPIEIVVICVFNFCKTGTAIILRAAATLLVTEVLPGSGSKESFSAIL